MLARICPSHFFVDNLVMVPYLLVADPMGGADQWICAHHGEDFRAELICWDFTLHLEVMPANGAVEIFQRHIFQVHGEIIELGIIVRQLKDAWTHLDIVDEQRITAELKMIGRGERVPVGDDEPRPDTVFSG